MVSQRETDRRLYQDVLNLAAETGDTEVARTMSGFGEPPYADLLAYGVVMQHYERLYKPVSPPQSYLERGAAHVWDTGPWGMLASEYSLVEKPNVLRGLMDMFSVMYPQLQGIDFRRDVPRLETEYVMFDGAAELTARRELALEWFAQLEAPRKRLYTFADSSHAVANEQFVAFRRILLETIVPETYAAP